LKTSRIRPLVCENDFQGKHSTPRIVAIADPSELQFELPVLGGTPALNDYMGDSLGLPPLVE